MENINEAMNIIIKRIAANQEIIGDLKNNQANVTHSDYVEGYYSGAINSLKETNAQLNTVLDMLANL